MVFLGIYFILGDLIYFIEWEIININSVCVVITILFDYISLIFMGFVMFISALVIYYREYYINGDENINRFIFLVLLFVLSIIFLIISPNIIRILLGWDGLGLVSYCLVIYYQNVKSYNAGILTALSNRVGDVALLIVIAWILNFGRWNYIFYLECLKYRMEMEIILILIIIAAITRRAQIPFSSWLPAAMAAPTPVSALVHSSTLVTAGVYLLIRFSVGFYDWLNNILLLIAGLTIFIAGLGANFEFDLKKIIALSTLSQLGLIIRILSFGLIKLAFFHLLTHALFKALLFICAGVIIHSVKDSQDIRFMGSLSFQMPFISSCLMVSNFALCGIPFLAGFYSKDIILEMVSLGYINIFGYFLFYLSTGLTVCYRFRLFYYALCGEYNLICFSSLGEKHLSIVKRIVGLLIMVILGGSILSWIIFPTPIFIFLPLLLKVFVVIVRLLGGWIGYNISRCKIGLSLLIIKYYYSRSILGSMWFIPYIFTYGISYYPLLIGYKSLRIFDGGWREYFGGQGIFSIFGIFSKINQWYQYNNLRAFIIFFIIWFIIIMIILLY